jgi:hypothetical protein
MTVDEMRVYLDSHGAIAGYHYVIDGLGGGEVDGICQQDGAWHTYFSERGERRQMRRWASEAEACAHLIERARAYAEETGDWRD